MGILKIDLSSFEGTQFERVNKSRFMASFSATDWLAIYSVDVHRLVVEIKRLETLLQRCIPFLQRVPQQISAASEFGTWPIHDYKFDEAQALLAELDAQPEVRSCTNCGSFAGYPDREYTTFCCSRKGLRIDRTPCAYWNAKVESTVKHMPLHGPLGECPLCGRTLMISTGVQLGTIDGETPRGPWHVECCRCRLHGPEAPTALEARSKWHELLRKIQQRDDWTTPIPEPVPQRFYSWVPSQKWLENRWIVNVNHTQKEWELSIARMSNAIGRLSPGNFGADKLLVARIESKGLARDYLGETQLINAATLLASALNADERGRPC
jgi:hypothetical protein